MALPSTLPTAMSRAVSLLLCLALVPAACSGPPKPPPLLAPTTSVSVDHYQGTPLSGPRLGLFDDYPAEPSEAPAEQALMVRVSAMAVAGMPGGGMVPLTSVARVAAMPLSGEPLRATLPLVDGGRIGRESGRLAQARERRHLADVTGALDLGMTCVVSLQDAARKGEHVRVLLHRRPDDEEGLALHLARTLSGDSGEDLNWEQALLDAAPVVGGEAVVLALPLDNGSGELVFEMAVTPARAGDLAHRVQVDRARSDASAHLTELRSMLERIREGVPDRTGVVAALQGLTSLEARRAAILHVASITGADATRDMALTGRPDLLEEVTEELKARIPDGYIPSLSELAWLCEQVSLIAATVRVEGDDDEPALEALLLRHTGEAGRNLPLVLGVLDAAHDLADLRERLVEENLLFLDDNSPASRVRAFDWLLMRGRAPEGYEPLGPRSARRAALARLAEAGSGSGAEEPSP